MEKTDLSLSRISYILLCVINLLRSGERIGSQTHWQPTRSHALRDWKTGANSYSDEKRREIN